MEDTQNIIKEQNRVVEPPRADWLALVQEAAIEPDLPICDAHHHLFDLPGFAYMLPQFLDDLAGGHNVQSTVYVECTAFYRANGEPALRPVGETGFAAGVSAMAASGRYGPAQVVAAIVPYADLSLGSAVEQVLEAHCAAGGGRVRGIRHASGWDASEYVKNSHTNPPRGLLLDARFRAGFALLAKYGLSFDAWLYHPQLGELLDLARAFPEQPIVIDHLGGLLRFAPYAERQAEELAAWWKSIAALAGCPNVHIKLGGLGMKSFGFRYGKQPVPPTSEQLAHDWKPLLDICIDAFGPERCMFESNFPVDKQSFSYSTMWNAFKRYAAGASRAEKAALFSGTASTFYRLPAQPQPQPRA
jgi:predicted TIM-barrel fold metal-dependent hydrolase